MEVTLPTCEVVDESVWPPIVDSALVGFRVNWVFVLAVGLPIERVLSDFVMIYKYIAGYFVGLLKKEWVDYILG